MKKVYHRYLTKPIFKPTYDISHISTGIVHLGLGAFHRAHQALYTDEAMSLSGRTDWGIAAASLKGEEELISHLKNQDYWYTVSECDAHQKRNIKLVGAIVEAMTIHDNRRPILKLMSRASTRIITLTVTEKGYHLLPGSHHLNVQDPMIQYDIKHPSHPKTAPGLIVEALSLRKQAGIPPFTILSCDNIIDNGPLTRSAVCELARHNNPALAQWIDKQVQFPSCIVDRIVPAVTPTDLDEISAKLGTPDQCAVITEPFRQWIIEDHFSLGRPDWDLVEGARFVKNIQPWQTMKLRLLNGTYSLLAYLGCLAGYQTIAEAMNDNDLMNFIRYYMFREAIPTLQIPPETNIAEYAEELLKRFSNSTLKHRTDQVASDGSRKIPIRWLPTLISLSATQRSFNCLALGIAAWLRYLSGRDDQQQAIVVNDPMVETLRSIASKAGHSDVEVVSLLLKESGLFSPEMTQSPTITGHIITYYQQLARFGVKTTLKKFNAAVC